MPAYLRGPKPLLCFSLNLAHPGHHVVHNDIRAALVLLDPERHIAGAAIMLDGGKIGAGATLLQGIGDVVPGHQAGPVACAGKTILERELEVRFRLMYRRLGVGAPQAITDGDARRNAYDENCGGGEAAVDCGKADAADDFSIEIARDGGPKIPQDTGFVCLHLGSQPESRHLVSRSFRLAPRQHLLSVINCDLAEFGEGGPQPFEDENQGMEQRAERPVRVNSGFAGRLAQGADKGREFGFKGVPHRTSRWGVVGSGHLQHGKPPHASQSATDAKLFSIARSHMVMS